MTLSPNKYMPYLCYYIRISNTVFTTLPLDQVLSHSKTITSSNYFFKIYSKFPSHVPMKIYPKNTTIAAGAQNGNVTKFPATRHRITVVSQVRVASFAAITLCVSFKQESVVMRVK